ncbi:hypothetical protein IMCC3317_42870 [Kordia antarctica]|uniref:Uncharacterized protein n=1 Tax=Kordia antarctica TaxID=1218801 RepID=A0A7L4ZQX2_9FLAO|nr:hypothetical protein [Kordia antarctica]QHI38887.1 hypothetical protein IMCC3317_42870 [Kordia antarctica]
MKTLNIDFLNTGLIILSFLLACWLPFELFLLSYAILGPLHYFTEINWIRDKNYFVVNKLWIYLIIIAAFLISIPALFQLPYLDQYQNNTAVQYIMRKLPLYFNAGLFLAIVAAIAFTVVKSKKHQYIVLSVGVLFAVLFHFFPFYHLIIGILLPTVIHVYLFTLIFMWYGNLKSKSRIGYFNVILLAVIPFIIVFLSISTLSYSIKIDTQRIYAENNFYILNIKLAEVLGLSDGKPFAFNKLVDIKIQIFIAFAYTYHYLNWFSKTTVIGWHKKLSKKRSITIILLWIFSVGLYFYNYKIGLIVLLFLSFLHVFMEFPLNIISIKAVGKSIFNPNKS